MTYLLSFILLGVNTPVWPPQYFFHSYSTATGALDNHWLIACGLWSLPLARGSCVPGSIH